jgi:hypothetical protein
MAIARLNIRVTFRVERNVFEKPLCGAFVPRLAEDLEEAIRMARYDSFLVGPEMAAGERVTKLREKKRAADHGGPPLTRRRRSRLAILVYSSMRHEVLDSGECGPVAEKHKKFELLHVPPQHNEAEGQRGRQDQKSWN